MLRNLVVATASAALGATSAGGVAVASGAFEQAHFQCAPPTFEKSGIVFQCIDQQYGPRYISVRPPANGNGWEIRMRAWDTLGH